MNIDSKLVGAMIAAGAAAAAVQLLLVLAGGGLVWSGLSEAERAAAGPILSERLPLLVAVAMVVLAVAAVAVQPLYRLSLIHI